MEDFGERFDGLDRRIDSLERRMDARFEAVDQRFQAMDRRLQALDEKVSRQFRWLVGGQVTVLVTVVGTLVTALSVR